MSRSPLNFLRFVLLLLITSGCAWFNAGEPMFPTITLDQSLDSFISKTEVTPDTLVSLAESHVQQQVGSMGEVFLGFVTADYQCRLKQCTLAYMSVEFYVNPLEAVPTLFGDEESRSINVIFFYDLLQNKVEASTYGPFPRVAATNSEWQGLPVSLEAALTFALDRVTIPNLENLSYYRLGLSLLGREWNAHFYYSDPDNRKSKADKTMTIPMEAP